MGKKKMSGSREPRKPKKEKSAKLADQTVSSILKGEKLPLKSAK